MLACRLQEYYLSVLKLIQSGEQQRGFRHHSEMFAFKKLCLLFVALYIIVFYKVYMIDFNYISKISSYVWRSSNEIVNTLSFYYHGITQQISVPYLSKGYDEIVNEDENSCEKNLNECRITATDSPDYISSRRIVRIVDMLLSQTNQMEGDSLIRGHMEWEATAPQLEALKNCALGILSIREVGPILNNVIKSADVDGVYRFTLWNNLWIIVICVKDVTVAILIMLYLFRRLRNITWNFWVIFSNAIQVELIVTFFVTWWELLQGENIEAIAIQCQPDKMGWKDKVMALISSNCNNHYEPIMKDHPADVTSEIAFLRTIDRINWGVITVISKISSILRKLWTDYMPWIDLWIIQPIAALKGFSLVAFVSTILALFCCYYHYSRNVERTFPRRSLNNNERWMIKVMRNVLESSYEHEGAVFMEHFRRFVRQRGGAYRG